MPIGPVELNGIIQRSQDVGMLKQQEDSKPLVDQQNIQAHLKEQVKTHMQQVHDADNANEPEYRYDAKEKGNNLYQRQQKKKKKKQDTEGKVVKKEDCNHFDIKI